MWPAVLGEVPRGEAQRGQRWSRERAGQGGHPRGGGEARPRRAAGRPLYIPGREPSVSARNKSGETGLAPGRRGLLCRAAGPGCSCAQRLHGGGATRRT